MTKPEIRHPTTHEDIADFVELHCELDPKVHAAYNEVASALLVFLQLRGRAVSTNDVLQWRNLVQHVVDSKPGLTLQGPEVYGPRPMSYVFLVGLRVVHFPGALGPETCAR